MYFNCVRTEVDNFVKIDCLIYYLHSCISDYGSNGENAGNKNVLHVLKYTIILLDYFFCSCIFCQNKLVPKLQIYVKVN